MNWECFSSFIKSLLSALWLVDDSAAVSLRYVLTRDRMTTFCFSVSSFCCSSCRLPCHLTVDTCALMDVRTSQATDRSRHHDTCNSHSCLTDPNLLFRGKPSEVVPSFPFGSGAAWLLRR